MISNTSSYVVHMIVLSILIFLFFCVCLIIVFCLLLYAISSISPSSLIVLRIDWRPEDNLLFRLLGVEISSSFIPLLLYLVMGGESNYGLIVPSSLVVFLEYSFLFCSSSCSNFFFAYSLILFLSSSNQSLH